MVEKRRENSEFLNFWYMRERERQGDAHTTAESLNIKLSRFLGRMENYAGGSDSLLAKRLG